MQVEGRAALAQVAQKVRAEGLLVLYQGALANALASFVGSYPWYFTFNLLRELLPHAPEGKLERLKATGASGVRCWGGREAWLRLQRLRASLLRSVNLGSLGPH